MRQPILGFVGTGDSMGPRFLRIPTAVGDDHLYALDDPELDLQSVLAEPLPPCPVDMALTGERSSSIFSRCSSHIRTFEAHWLSVEGVQPAIPQNPPVGRSVVASTETSETRQLVQHTLSKEMQLYFERVTSAILENNSQLISAAIDSLASDPGLSQLLPYFTQFITQKVPRPCARDRATHHLGHCRSWQVCAISPSCSRSFVWLAHFCGTRISLSTLMYACALLQSRVRTLLSLPLSLPLTCSCGRRSCTKSSWPCSPAASASASLPTSRRITGNFAILLLSWLAAYASALAMRILISLAALPKLSRTRSWTHPSHSQHDTALWPA
jgi:hypothetical protein